MYTTNGRTCWAIVLLAMGLAATASAPAVTIHVSPVGADTNDGLTWPTAKATIQAGLDAAVSGDRVWVAAGTYVQCISSKSSVALYGGFVGDETDLSQRNWVANRTILDGNQSGSVVTIAFGVSATRIDGFTIRNGKAWPQGGGVRCSEQSAIIANCLITGNRGSGIWCKNASVAIVSTTVAGNVDSRDGGGGIYCTSSTVTIRDSMITANSTSSDGGGIRCRSWNSLTVTNSIIVGNSASRGGGISLTEGASSTIVNSTIAGNGASDGGGIYCSSGELAISNSTVVGNSASTEGGAVHCQSGYPSSISNTILAFNTSGIYGHVASLRYNCVYGNRTYNYSFGIDPTGTNGNISADPMFASLEFGKLQIQPNSPCVDAGDDSVMQSEWTDMDGQPRKQGLHVDIGADESDGTTWPAGPEVVVRVTPEGDDASTGASWAQAKRTVQAAVDVAVATGGEVWVAEGVYAGQITLHSFVHMYGGFAGNETQKGERDWSTHVTVLDGNQAGSVVTATGFAQGLGTIDGFTIRNGSGTAVRGQLYYDLRLCGGGIYCLNASPTIRNNRVIGNTAIGTGGSGNGCNYGYGGGIYCASSYATIASNEILYNSTFGLGNTGNGGGIYCNGGVPEIVNNTITGNATFYGGGVYCGSPGLIANNTIVGNGAAFGGGMYCGPATVINNTIAGNDAARGGGIYCFGVTTIVDTLVAWNSSGIHCGGSGTLRHNCVYGNREYNYSGIDDPTGTDGNLSLDPKLACLRYGNLHLQPDSPCVDAGDDSAVNGGWRDVDGQPRTTGPHVDIGADESDGTAWAAGPYAIVRVSPEGDDSNDGSSWAAAKRTVQAAIDTAAAAGGEVWVAAGTYPERIVLWNYAHVYGGFRGEETERAARNWSTHRTILDGQSGGSVVTATGIGSRLSTIDGFTIQNGSGTQDDGMFSGGGFYLLGASPVIANNTITGNSASWCGGGFYCQVSSPTIINNTITSNSAYHGGGMFCVIYSSPVIANNTITSNGGDSGGGMFLGPDGSPVVANTIVAFNSSGIDAYELQAGSMRNNCVFGNSAYNYSGMADPTGTDGNISDDPRLAAASYGDVHIQPESPCVDAGDDGVVEADWQDMDGQPRLAGAHVDIGADESDGIVRPSGPYLIVRVSPEGDDANDGSSWESAKGTVQAGIDAAAAVGGDVWVRAGTYMETITLPNHVRIYGGFAGTEMERSERDWFTHSSVLDGSSGGSVVTSTDAGYGLNRIDGFTIANGREFGVYCFHSSPVITNNTIMGNSAGGIYCSHYFASITSNTIAGNGSPAGWHGGIYCSWSMATIANNMIIGNAASWGGGISSSSSMAITNNTIMGNSASRGGGIYLGYSQTIANNGIIGNSATSDGGGIYINCNGWSPSLITNNTIACNSANLSGGGVYCWSQSTTRVPVITSTIVAFNSSGISCGDEGTPTMRYNCVFGNMAYNYLDMPDPTGTDGNISADPLFVRLPDAGPNSTWGTSDDDYGDLRLLPFSPCVDAGNNADVPGDAVDLDGDGDVAESLPVDLAGGVRFLDDPQVADTGVGTAPIVDIGAYERGRPVGDVDGDWLTDVADLLWLVESFGKSQGDAGFDPRCDFNGDGMVDSGDLLDIVYNFGR